jgi:biopolymer transport protein ExbD
MPIKRHVRLVKGRLDLTPLIDIIFLLLIFFMLSSSFVLQPGIKVDLPEAVSTQTIENINNILITLTSNGNVYFNDTIISVENLWKILLDTGKSTVLIQADGEVDLRYVVAVWDVCRRAGIKTINIVTSQKKL